MHRPQSQTSRPSTTHSQASHTHRYQPKPPHRDTNPTLPTPSRATTPPRRPLPPQQRTQLRIDTRPLRPDLTYSHLYRHRRHLLAKGASHPRLRPPHPRTPSRSSRSTHSQHQTRYAAITSGTNHRLLPSTVKHPNTTPQAHTKPHPKKERPPDKTLRRQPHIPRLPSPPTSTRYPRPALPSHPKPPTNIPTFLTSTYPFPTPQQALHPDSRWPKCYTTVP